jgi:hypothetical protein
MPFHAALDVSLETTSICVVDGEGTIVREGQVATDPDAIAAFWRMEENPLSDAALRRARSRPGSMAS